MHYSQKSINNKTLFYGWFPAMFTRIDIILLTDDLKKNLVCIAETIKTEIERLELLANRFDSQSELSKINSSAFEKPILISTEMFQIIEECLMYNTKTLGLFDITINSTNALSDAISKVKLNKKEQSIHLLHSDLQLDLSGFVKGYALRAIKQILIEKNIENALINMGNSSIYARGNHPFGKGWKIAIPAKKKPLASELFDQCLTTSGNKTTTKWPIKQPQTKTPKQNINLMSVITDDPAVGEVLSIALYLANTAEKQTILEQLNGKIINLN